MNYNDEKYTWIDWRVFPTVFDLLVLHSIRAIAHLRWYKHVWNDIWTECQYLVPLWARHHKVDASISFIITDLGNGLHLRCQAIADTSGDSFIIFIHKIQKRTWCSSPSSAAYMRQWTGSPLVQIMACRLFGAKPLSEPMLGFCQLNPY